jgi:glycosyltransferase involved in cell wall biosynthesis
MTKLAIVLPCYNEEAVLESSIGRLTELLTSLIEQGTISAESYLLFVNDGSNDHTWQIINKHYEVNPYVYGISLAGNVGHQLAIMAGMEEVKDKCDAAITIDADLQDDIQAIEKMVHLFQEGFEIVYGVKVCRKADSLIKRNSAKAFYKLQKSMGVKSVYNHADFRLLSRRALQQLCLYHERNLYLRGLIPLLGFKSATVDDVIHEREAGVSKYTLSKMLALAADGITSFSVRPITIILNLGFLFLLISIFMAIYVLHAYIIHVTIPGWTSIMLSMWFIGSILLLAIGVVGQYIGKIYIEVKNRPRYNIDETLCRKKSQKL